MHVHSNTHISLFNQWIFVFHLERHKPADSILWAKGGKRGKILTLSPVLVIVPNFLERPCVCGWRVPLVRLLHEQTSRLSGGGRAVRLSVAEWVTCGFCFLKRLWTNFPDFTVLVLQIYGIFKVCLLDVACFFLDSLLVGLQFHFLKPSKSITTHSFAFVFPKFRWHLLIGGASFLINCSHMGLYFFLLLVAFLCIFWRQQR